MSFSLPRTVQCATCPWKVGADPYQIPGYSPEKHAKLACSIAEPGSLDFNNTVMSCHYSNGEDNMFCVGWLYNQLGEGNNIGLRLRMRHCENIGQLRVFGLQHQRFEDTLPE